MAIAIIAEAGVNHNGDLKLAKQLALAAKEAGADMVKYQVAVPELVVSRFAEKADYQKVQTGEKESQLEMVRRLHFDFEAHRELRAYCQEIGIVYFATAFDLQSLAFLDELGLPMHKIPSGEITNLPFLQAVAACKKPVLLSTGMSFLAEVEDAVSALEEGGASEIILLHCNTEYPTPFEDANLLAMHTLAEAFGLRVGYSDHTQGVSCGIAAAALGACVIEKHFTLDKSMPGPDHKASLDPQELRVLVEGVRQCEAALGDGEKRVRKSEEKNRNIARKSIVAATFVKKGDIFTRENLATKRPANGISPMRWHAVLGQRAKRDFAPDETIEV